MTLRSACAGMVVLRMLRLLKILQLMSEVGQIRSVLSGLAHGLHALIFVLLVFSVIFYVYGLMGLMLFGVADEFHFGNVGKALVTMSRMAMGPWHDVMKINLYGCGHHLAAAGTSQIRSLYCTEANLLDDGTPIDFKDTWHRTAVILYFLSFKIICGFVALSLLFGVITTAMAKALKKTNEKKFEALRQKRQEKAQKMLVRSRNAARMEAEVDTVRRYATKW